MDKLTTRNLVRLLEATDKTGSEWKVCIIEEGPSKNSIGGLPVYYTAEVLKKAAPLFENLKACIYEFSDKVLKHLPTDVQDRMGDKFPKNIVGWYENVHFGEFKDSEGKTRRGLLANFHITENAGWLRQLMKDAWDHGKRLLGFSINGEGRMCPTKILGRMVNAVKELTKAHSVEVVTHPAAGGQALRLMACANENELEDNEMEYLKKLLEMLAVKSPDAVEGIDPENITEEQEIDLLEAAFKADAEGTLKVLAEAEMLAGLLAKLAGAVKGNPKALDLVKQMQDAIKKYPKAGYKAPTKAADDDKDKADADAKAKADADKAKVDADAKAKADASKSDAEKAKESADKAQKVKEEIMQINCNSLLDATMSNSKLPVPVQEDIKERFKDRIFEAKELDTAINKQMDILAKLSESGEIKNLGKTNVEVSLAEEDKHQAAMDRMIDPEAEASDKLKKVGAFRGLKEAYTAITGDADVTGRLPRERLSEAMSFVDFPNMLGSSMTKRMVKDYQLYPVTWPKISNIRPVKDFKTQDAIRWGGFGRLPAVAEKGAYTDLYGASEEKVTFAVSKKGGLAYVTMEQIKSDDLNSVRKIPKNLARSAAETLEYDVWNPILGNATNIYDSTYLGTVSHANYATGALDSATLSAAKTRMLKQWSRGSVLESGTTTGTLATTTLEDDSKAWTVNAYAGKYVRLMTNAGAGAQSLIASNTATVLTFAAVPLAPEVGTTFEISVASAHDPRIGLRLKTLAVSPDLEPKAIILRDSILKPGGANNDINIHKGSFDIVVPLWMNDVTDFFGLADKSMIDMVELGFLDGKDTPELFIQDAPAVGNVFSNDQITYKVRFIYGFPTGAVIDYRGIDVNIVAG